MQGGDHGIARQRIDTCLVTLPREGTASRSGTIRGLANGKSLKLAALLALLSPLTV
jgi:hypothetical protein